MSRCLRPTIRTLPGAASRAAPRPRQGPSIILCGSTGALPRPSRARNVRWIASGVSSGPRVTRAQPLRGQMPPEGCFSSAWKRSRPATAGVQARAMRDTSRLTFHPPAAADCQIESGRPLRLASSWSGWRLTATGAVGREKGPGPFCGHKPRARSAVMTLS